MDDPVYRKELLTTLTRYLYSRIEAKQSLFVSLLMRDTKQSLFWGYELFYSGFREETYDFVKDIYNEIYADDNPDMKPFIDNLIDEWYNTSDDSADCNLGSIIYTLSLRKYNLVNFIKEKLTYTATKDVDDDTTAQMCFISMTPEHIQPFATKLVSTDTASYLFSTLHLYPAIKIYNNLFNTEMPDEFSTIYHSPLDKWLYSASRSPCWLERIEEHNGIINNESKIVEFPDSNDETQFCKLWDYEQDEQLSHIRQMSLGNPADKQQTIKQFCKRFKHSIVCKPTKRKIVKK
jgi:hypothetical protein